MNSDRKTGIAKEIIVKISINMDRAVVNTAEFDLPYL